MDLTTLSDRELVRLCLEATPDRIVGGCQGGNLVVKTSNDTVIKFGVGVTEDEANNQRQAYELLDYAIVHVRVSIVSSPTNLDVAISLWNTLKAT